MPDGLAEDVRRTMLCKRAPVVKAIFRTGLSWASNFMRSWTALPRFCFFKTKALPEKPRLATRRLSS